MGRKTVKDVVAYFGKSLLLNNKWTHIRFDEQCGNLFATYGSGKGWLLSYEVCNRAQYEAYLSEQRSDDWTHIDEDGSICRILHTIDDKAWVTFKCDDYFDDVVELEDLKPYEPEWTHRTNAGELCKIHVKEPDVNGVIIVINERGEYLRHNSDSLKPCH